MVIDLHCHTTNSDGTWSTIELLKKAEDKGIKLLAITDHDTTKAHFELDKIKIKDYFSGKIIVGAEINCVFHNTKIELLAYNFKKEPIQDWLEKKFGKEAIKKNMIREFEEMKEICKKNQVQISNDLKYNPDNEYPIDVIYDNMLHYEENKKLFDKEVWNSKSLFFRKCTTDKDFILFRDFTKDYPSAKEVSEIIHENGGKVFLAHLFVYGLDNPIAFLDEITKENILDGIETYYSRFTKEQIEIIENYCIKHHLYKSGGSDCHGKKHQGLELGTGFGNLNVKEEAIKEWI